MESLPRQGSIHLRAYGGSMRPAIQPGDLLSFRACDAGAPRPGQVVLMQRGERLFAHRLLRRDAEFLVTRGDALGAPDPAWSPAELLGVLVLQQRDGRELEPRTSPPPRLARLAFSVLRDLSRRVRHPGRAGSAQPDPQPA